MRLRGKKVQRERQAAIPCLPYPCAGLSGSFRDSTARSVPSPVVRSYNEVQCFRRKRQ